MSEEIEPALTADDWARELSVADLHPFLDTEKIIAVANAALPDSDPRKITRERIALLRVELGWAENAEYSNDPEARRFLDALESYLPPTEGT